MGFTVVALSVGEDKMKKTNIKKKEGLETSAIIFFWFAMILLIPVGTIILNNYIETNIGLMIFALMASMGSVFLIGSLSMFFIMIINFILESRIKAGIEEALKEKDNVHHPKHK